MGHRFWVNASSLGINQNGMISIDRICRILLYDKIFLNVLKLVISEFISFHRKIYHYVATWMIANTTRHMPLKAFKRSMIFELKVVLS